MNMTFSLIGHASRVLSLTSLSVYAVRRNLAECARIRHTGWYAVAVRFS